MMGYEIQKRTIQLFDSTESVFNFSLKTKVLEGKEISITAKRPKEWKNHLQLFEKLFFSVDKFAKECKLLNPEVLDFNFVKKRQKF